MRCKIVKSGALKIKFYPLSIGLLQDNEEDVQVLMGIGKEFKNPFDPVRLTHLLNLYTLSAKIGDPSITEDQVKRVVNLDNMGVINRAVLGNMKDDDGAVDEETPL